MVDFEWPPAKNDKADRDSLRMSISNLNDPKNKDFCWPIISRL
jgi:hypothetical protein